MEKPKMASKEEINEGIEKERDGWLVPIVGIIVSLIGYVAYDFHINRYYINPTTGRKVLLNSEYPYQLLGLLMIIIGIVTISIGIIKKIYSRV